ncbi:MAG: signal transduction histidine kinase [Oceanicoccus sp.]|jgi:signal transduction histidine kinase
MVVNPSLEIYLLSKQGRILSHAMPTDTVKSNRVSLAPINEFLSRQESNLLLGDDPRNPDQKNIFSVHPVMENGELQGYLYAILAGHNFQQLMAKAKQSHSLLNAASILTICFSVALLSGVAAFYFLTRRLTTLTKAVANLDMEPQNPANIRHLPRSRHHDEIDSLAVTFEQLVEKNHQQYLLLEDADANRREMFANISHDLRTPLTSMQGYIETLLLKADDLDKEKVNEFLVIAHKQSLRIGNLINGLFELAKLDNGKVVPNIESFSLLELIYDQAQDFELKARKKSVEISIQADCGDIVVNADIQLIQRVFENLLANAIRYTPRQGKILISLGLNDDGRVIVKVANDGDSISESKRKLIFQRFYRAHDPAEDVDEEQHHSGIGLAIVEKILLLHQCQIRLSEKKRNGAEFIFDLPI